jgi:prepilin-type N-terminal cleavage/methylation domain-containing protein
MNARKCRLNGFTLIEVLIGIVIFAVGMMALAHLQGNLSKSSAESTARTVATNIAEERIEALRSFSQVPPSESAAAFANIVSDDPDNPPAPIVVGGISYTVNQTVTDYYYNPVTKQFQPTKPNSLIVYPDLKRLAMTVSWGAGDNARSFQIDETNSTNGLGTGSVTVVDLISSYTTTSGTKVVLNGYGDSLYAPPVDYNPGENPDIISIHLGANKFKESTTPLPDVIRADELVETRFDVVTYSQDDSGATFLRREEFRTVSCECTLQVPQSSTEGGRRPAIWNGVDYTEGEFVSKPYGESASNTQSQYCNICCRDHHDGGTGSEDVGADPGRSRFNPFRDSLDYYGAENSALEGDHLHFDRNRTGVLTLAENDGDTYDEVCRMVRKDGFWRIAQDLRQEGFNGFPASYLDDENEVGTYSRYVTDAVSAYELATDPGNSDNPTNAYESSPPTLTRPENMDPALLFPASTRLRATRMEDGGVTQQQLRSRGIYLDYMSDELRAKINCLDNLRDDCDVPGVTTALEIIPFYDVQLTWLSRWNETPNNYPIDVTNEAIADNNQHSRGMATLEAGTGYSTINTAVHTGNLGLTGTDPIDPGDLTEVAAYNLYALAVDASSPPPLSGIVISGQILSSVAGVRASDVEIISTEDAQCDRTLTGYECVLVVGALNPRMTVSNYFKRNTDLYGCSAVLSVNGTEHSGSTPDHSWTRFNLPLSGTVNADIVLKAGSCL